MPKTYRFQKESSGYWRRRYSVVYEDMHFGEVMLDTDREQDQQWQFRRIDGRIFYGRRRVDVVEAGINSWEVNRDQ